MAEIKVLPRISRDQSASAGLYLNCVCVCCVVRSSESVRILTSAKTFLVSAEKAHMTTRRLNKCKVILYLLPTTYTCALLVDGLSGEYPALVAEQCVVKLQVPSIQNLLRFWSPSRGGG